MLRKNTEMQKKTKIHEWYGPPHNAWFDGEIKDLHRAGKVAVKYTDGSKNLLEPHEAQANIDVRPLAEWKRLMQQVKNGIGYLRNRLTGNCEPNYDCTQMYEVYRLVQAFDQPGGALVAGEHLEWRHPIARPWEQHLRRCRRAHGRRGALRQPLPARFASRHLAFAGKK